MSLCYWHHILVWRFNQITFCNMTHPTGGVFERKLPPNSPFKFLHPLSLGFLGSCANSWVSTVLEAHEVLRGPGQPSRSLILRSGCHFRSDTEFHGWKIAFSTPWFLLLVVFFSVSQHRIVLMKLTSLGLHLFVFWRSLTWSMYYFSPRGEGWWISYIFTRKYRVT